MVSTKYIADYYRVKVSSANKNDCQYRDYYITGEQQGRGAYISIDSLSDANSIFSGHCITYYKNGEVASERNYIAGVLAGECIEYNDNGLIRRHNRFVDGKLHGIQTEFDGENNCIQMEYIGNVPADYYTVSNANGCMMTYSTSSGEPLWLSPTSEEKQIEYKDGIEWQFYTKNGLTIYLAKSVVKDYGKYYKVDLFIVNNSLEPIEFDPISCVSAYTLKSYYNEVDRRHVLSSTEYINKVRNRQNWNTAIVALSEGLAAAGAGYSTSTTHTSSNVSGSMYASGSGGRAYGSYSGHGNTISTTRQYDAAAAYQANAIARNRVDNIVATQQIERTVRDEEYLKKTTIYPSEVVAGYLNIDRDLNDSFVKVVIDINGAEYVFQDAIFDRLSSSNGYPDTIFGVDLQREYSAESITCKTKCTECEILNIKFYNDCTKVTFRYVNPDDGVSYCAIDSKNAILYFLHNNNAASAKLIKAHNIPSEPEKYSFSKKGEELVFDLYFKPIPDDVNFLEIIGNKKNKMHWRSIKLGN